MSVSNFVCGDCGESFAKERGLAQHHRWCNPAPDLVLLECPCKGFKCAKFEVLKHHCLSCEVALASYQDCLLSDPLDVRLEYAKNQDTSRGAPPPLSKRSWRELWVAWFSRRTELSAANAQELIDFVEYCTGGDMKLAKFKTVLTRIKENRVYPTERISDIMEKVHVFEDVPEEYGGDSNNQVIFRYVWRLLAAGFMYSNGY